MTGIEQWLLPRLGIKSPPWTLHRKQADHLYLKPAAECKPIAYPKPDGKLTFDRLSSVFVSNTNHAENQPPHLTLKDASVPVQVNLAKYAGPESRYCPAGGLRVRRRRRHRAAADQRPELRALQDLRHQGPDPEHRLDPARRRRRAELRRHVNQRNPAMPEASSTPSATPPADAPEVLTAARLWPQDDGGAARRVPGPRPHPPGGSGGVRGRGAAHPRHRRERRIEGAARADRAAAGARDDLGLRRRLRRRRRRGGARARHRRHPHAQRPQRRGRRPGAGARARRLAPPGRGRPLRAQRRVGEGTDAARPQGERRAHGHRRPGPDRPGDREARRGLRHVDRLHLAQREGREPLPVLPERRGAGGARSTSSSSSRRAARAPES